MKITQLSVFLENKPGQLLAPCQALAEAGINILTLSVADTPRYGILRLIIGEHQRAQEVLEQAGCVVQTTDVLAVEVPDRPGGLVEILSAIEDQSVNVEYMYAFSFHSSKKALLVFRFDDLDRALAVLQAKHLNVLSGIELFN